MDRKHELNSTETDVERGAAPEERTGDILGLSSGPIAKTADDPSTDYDPEAVAKRRARMNDSADGLVSDRSPARTSGATGADMGAGGSGTGVSGE